MRQVQEQQIIDVPSDQAQASPPATVGSGELAEQQASVPALIDNSDPWLEVDEGDLAAPDTRSGSPFPLLTLNRKAGGGFVDETTGEKFTETDFVWLARATSRAWWEKDYEGKDAAGPPDCRSFDGITPDPNSPQLQSEKCASCPMSKFTDDGKAPPCSEASEMMVFLPDSAGGYGRLARLRMNGLAIAATKAFWLSFRDRLPKRPPIAFLSHVTLEEKETDMGTFLVPRYTRVRELSFAEAQPIIEERDRRIEEWKKNLAADVTEGRVGAPGDAGATTNPDPFPDEPAPQQEATAPQGGTQQPIDEYAEEPF